jgi:hypothetical protein
MHAFATNYYWFYFNALQHYEAHYVGTPRPLFYSIFSAATFLLGNKALKPLEDDLAWGWSAFTTLGTYNADTGGHIILWDLNLLVRFPPGATILIPRALVRYSFVRIAAHETRYCLIQFTPAPIFKFCGNGGRSDLEFARNATRAEHEEREADRTSYADGEVPLQMLTTVAELEEVIRVYPVPPRINPAPHYPL